MIAFDYYGVSVIIGAVFAGIAACIGAFNAHGGVQLRRSVSTNGDTRNIGQAVSDMANKLAPPDSETPPA